MENKYYVPQIEEFRVGFEYEELIYTSVYDERWRINIKKHIFETKTWERGFPNFQWLNTLEEGKIRVKYLDSEDIESLGFKVCTENNFIYCQYKELDFYLDYDVENKLCKIHGLYEVLFRGIIKNKSELIFILKCIKPLIKPFKN